MTPCYRYGLLDPRPLPAAESVNAGLLGPLTLGVEVTEPRLAARCGLGNIDPQHRPEGGSVAAIEAALDWPLPPPPACMVTIRRDADAFGAMAVFNLRAAGIPIGPAMRARIDLIGRADRFDHSAWPGRRGLPERADDIEEAGVGTQGLGALIGGLVDPAFTAGEAAAAACAWIGSEHVPAAWSARAMQAAGTLFTAYRNGRIRLTELDPGRIALVEGCIPGSLRLGYRLAPIVVALDETPRGAPLIPWRRITVAQWQVGHVDLIRAASVLAAREPGWGGAPAIIGSPQGLPCRTAIRDVLAVLRDCGA
jgi:hypothetical protein